MGLLDALLNMGKKALKDTADDFSGNAAYSYDNSNSAEDDNGEYDESASFDEKLKGVVDELTGITVEKNINPDIFEQQSGQTIYARGGNRCAPDWISYKLTKENGQILYIRFWDYYETYDHVANRQIRAYCDAHGIRLLDFFDHLPNRYGYMKKRIQDNF